MSERSTPVVLGNARFTVQSSGCVRMEYAGEGAFSPFPSVLVGKKMAKPACADVVVKGRKLRIKTDGFELNYTDNGHPFSAENLTITHTNTAGKREVWALGKTDAGNLGTVCRSLDQWLSNSGPEHTPVEGLLSTDGGHLVEDKARVYWNTDYDWPQCREYAVVFDGYFFAYGADFKQALKDFVTVFGSIPMVPRWTFGFWYSRWHDYTGEELVRLARRYRKEGIPLDVMIIDTDWRAGWGGYDWLPKYFPNPEKTLADLHDMGLQTSLNDHPGYHKYDGIPGADSHIPEIAKRLGPLPHQGEWACDWSNKAAVDTWRDVLFSPFFDQGMDFWWVDGYAKSAFGSLDAQLWVNHHYFDVAEEKTGKRGMILSRWGGIGSHRYPVQFSGDTASDWSVLSYQIQFTAWSGNLGAAYWSHDIGGFYGRRIDEELFIRWSQFGAMSPVFRTHSDHGIREPWAFSPKAKRIFRKQTRIRYALAPYFYNLAREAHETGLPILRPLYLEYGPHDRRALHRKHQYLIGKDILVAPADGAGDPRTGLFTKKVFFPEGRWYALESGDVIDGPRDSHVDIPLDIIPTYVRQGAIIPSQSVRDSIGTQPPDEMQFDYYPERDEFSECVLYEDDGQSMGYLKREFAKTRIKGQATGNSLELSIARPKGNYKGMPEKRTYVARILIGHCDEIAAVECKVGKSAWAAAKHEISSECLAGTAKGGHRFCAVSVCASNATVKVRITLA